VTEATPVDVKQSATGPIYHYRHGLWRYPMRRLTLGDIRSFLAKVDELDIPDDREVTAVCRQRGPRITHHVFSLSTDAQGTQ
jgi:hypothetical protein